MGLGKSGRSSRGDVISGLLGICWQAMNVNLECARFKPQGPKTFKQRQMHGGMANIRTGQDGGCISRLCIGRGEGINEDAGVWDDCLLAARLAA